ncbi:hypothetical protein [Vagococcus zengguangii]|uniref:Uncharacterized protein n=1 Tax=Vagococcus zengguangii TaxID=2571750 RepID=A0A4D7CSI0_9ENTE|nr:hypothetical protein [Vagococcus zengguangii]QCI85632.1 hypothetical protein FA707_01005 [Vagococcus zengguangii]TLG79583.1 hypothetical protein FE258_08350 [Vagococcus zengguangii]
MDDLFLIFFGLFMLASFVMISYMFKSLAVVGDERRKMIIQKSAADSFAIITGVFLIKIIEEFIKIFTTDGALIKHSSPFNWLLISSLLFTVNLYLNKRKYS